MWRAQCPPDSLTPLLPSDPLGAQRAAARDQGRAGGPQVSWVGRGPRHAHRRCLPPGPLPPDGVSRAPRSRGGSCSSSLPAVCPCLCLRTCPQVASLRPALRPRDPPPQYRAERRSTSRADVAPVASARAPRPPSHPSQGHPSIQSPLSRPDGLRCHCRICYSDTSGPQEDQYPPNIAVKVNHSYCSVPVSGAPRRPWACSRGRG